MTIRVWRLVTSLMFGIAFAAGPALASSTETAPVAEAPDLRKPIEMPAHERLMQTITSVGAMPGAFTTDGCSGGMSVGWALLAEQAPNLPQRADGFPPWHSCCVTHDRAYHNAGGARSAAESYAARLEADIALQACVAATAQTPDAPATTQLDELYALLARGMFAAVRLGGGPCTGLPWRWGYGYDPC